MWEQLISQLLALLTFFAFPALQYLWLRRFTQREGRPELWYLPRYGFRLVAHNISGQRTLSDIRYRTILRKFIPRGAGSSVVTLQDTLLVEREEFFLFPGTDQVLLSFKLELAASGELIFVHTDKLGKELGRHSVSEDDRIVSDYTATVENLFNFDIRLAKRTELNGKSLLQMLSEAPTNEREFPIDRIRDVG